jgi:hypothetical protein
MHQVTRIAIEEGRDTTGYLMTEVARLAELLRKKNPFVLTVCEEGIPV